MNDLIEFSNALRLLTVRASQHVPHHLGGSLSCVEIITVLYKKSMRLDIPKDLFVLSKGHAAITYYAALCMLGYLNKKELALMGRPGAKLLGHPCTTTINEVAFSTGSLGLGISYSAGVAYGLLRQNDERRIFVLLGDGELQAGIVWETFLFVAHHHLRNLIVIVDQNGMQTDGCTTSILSVEKVPQMLEALGLNVKQCDGHNVNQLADALSPCAENATVVFAKTIKGKGVSFMEGRPEWHSGIISEEEFQQACTELEKPKLAIKHA